MTKKYVIGVDYGTQSGRAVLVDLSNGLEVADHVTPYRHHVMDEQLPSEFKLEHDWALQHPQDYIEVLEQSIPAVLKEANIAAEQVIGLGIDFTACTMLPINKDLEPLCLQQKWKDNPHAWVKLWKHHAAQEEANLINERALERGEAWLSRYGGKISSEWMIAKVWQIANEAPEVYEEADQFVEATDWVISQLTGTLLRNSCTAGYKAIWHKREGYPSREFFKALSPILEDVTETKLRGEVVALGTKAGTISETFAAKIGLTKSTAVAVGNVDAHAAVPAVGVVEPGKLVMAMGTSICHMLLGTEEKLVEGMCGVVEDGIIPGYYGYEAGQSAVGDIFEWFVDECVPKYVYDEADKAGMNIHQYLTFKAAELKPGQSGLVALDWWNGNRSVLVDTDLTGVIVGMNLLTKPWEIYRALLEATAFGTRKIIESFHLNGVEVNELYACGGLPQKNALLMQIYADVTNREIKIAASKQTPALGAAMFGAVAAGSENGGYNTIIDAAKHMAKVKDEIYKPNKVNIAIYDKLYEEYNQLHDYFGRGTNDVMKRLKQLKESIR